MSCQTACQFFGGKYVTQGLDAYVVQRSVTASKQSLDCNPPASALTGTCHTRPCRSGRGRTGLKTVIPDD
jgi:hypothetical protein